MKFKLIVMLLLLVGCEYDVGFRPGQVACTVLNDERVMVVGNYALGDERLVRFSDGSARYLRKFELKECKQ